MPWYVRQAKLARGTLCPTEPIVPSREGAVIRLPGVVNYHTYTAFRS